MLASPGWRERNRQGHVLGAFTAGLLLGGTVAAAALWLLSGLTQPLPQPGRELALLALGALGLLRDANIVAIPLPQNARQIPQSVLQRNLLGAFQFGFELGTGVRTFVSSTAPYVVAAGLLLAGAGLPAALLAGLGFGAGRALTPLVRYWSGKTATWDQRMASRLPWIVPGASAAIVVILALLLLP